MCSHDANIAHQHKLFKFIITEKKWHVQNWLFPDRPTENARSYCETKHQALCNIPAPLLSSLSPYKIPPPFNLNMTYFQRFRRKKLTCCFALSSVKWLHSKFRLCSLSLQQHQLACARDLTRNKRLPNSKDHSAALQPSTLSNYTSPTPPSNQIFRL